MESLKIHVHPFAEVAQPVEQRTENPYKVRTTRLNLGQEVRMVTRQSHLIKDIQEVFGDDPRVQEIMKRQESRKRQPSPPPPLGGLGIREAAKRYHVPPSTISGWVKHGKIPTKLHSQYRRYIDEAALLKVLQTHFPGRGRRPAAS